MQIDAIVDRAKELGYASVALTDVMTISGMVPFSLRCKKAGIKPVIGVTLRVYRDPTYRPPGVKSGEVEIPNPQFRMNAYALNDSGMKAIMQLLTRGNSSTHFYYHARVGVEDILELLPPSDVFLTTGDIFNLFHMENHEEILRGFVDAGYRTLVELVPIDTPLFDTLNERAAKAARNVNVGTVASYPALYPEDCAGTLDVLRAITSNNKMTDPWLPIPYVRDWTMGDARSLAERMIGLGKRIGLTAAEVKLALMRTSDIADCCEYEFKKMAPCLPKMAEDEFGKMVEECKKGWVRRFSKPILGHKPTAEDMPQYKKRLAYELGVLKNLGFANYFLLTQDIVNWSKGNGIVVGPGRGSVGGSLVAYLMGITDVDPIRFNLIFERFINPDRIDLPDADLDFMSSRRHEVVAYITEKYGRENVAGISNYSTLGPASALRDSSRVHQLSPFDYACSKQVEKEHGQSVPLEESAATVPDIQKFKEAYPEIWKHATILEGCMRNLGQHAAGVIVAGEPINNRAVLLNKDKNTLPVVSWDKQVVEDFGLIKMDILGLATLDVLSLALQYVAERHGKKIDLLRISLDEPSVMAAFGKADTTGVFQFDGSGMKKLLKDLACLSPLTFEDITAATALFRPGPIDAGLLDQFVAIKQGKRAASYDHPLVEDALKRTYGVIVYQEQVMQICRDLAGFTMAEADSIRKAIGKKDKEKMKSYGGQFVAGAQSGQVEVEFEDGTKKLVHRLRKLKVAEGGSYTIEEVFAKGLTLSDTL